MFLPRSGSVRPIVVERYRKKKEKKINKNHLILALEEPRIHHQGTMNFCIKKLMAMHPAVDGKKQNKKRQTLKNLFFSTIFLFSVVESTCVTCYNISNIFFLNPEIFRTFSGNIFETILLVSESIGQKPSTPSRSEAAAAAHVGRVFLRCGVRHVFFHPQGFELLDTRLLVPPACPGGQCSMEDLTWSY